MTQTAVIPDYLKPAMERLETAWSAHLASASRMDETTAAISQVEAQKKELEQENDNDSGAWRTAFRAGGAVITDELKQRHLARVARGELVQECDNTAEVLSFELDSFKGACDRTARAYRQAHHSVLSQYAEHELNAALRDTCSALVRAMKLNILVLNNPLANTTGHQGYTEPEKVVMQQVKDRLEQAVKGCDIRLTDEPVLFKTGLSASTLPHMEHDVAVTPGQRKVWQEKMQEREAGLKARGMLS
ncbi:TPA: glycoprotein 3 [Escherichia coli]|uniref:Glycoprotein 3 n=1 Tax=Escherichia coli TaxID=562 RepID=A0A8S7XXT0_ECOLX|nr:glycoprotein 3 [Escherichia coli]EFM1444256.1 glycoprotein 3 [Escherichia coli]MBV2403895.1 glycoprotein 3 [Escherichia coli]MWS96439.1 glycoprotein 3 [Escherichia coli]HAI0078228.1 glycoprotein 3 [Escherichia coli]HCO5615851.1 glycoprotein 3 [Escherichia coli]